MTYYTGLDGPATGEGKTQPCDDMPIGELHRLAGSKKRYVSVAQHAMFTGYVHFAIFLRTNLPADLENAIECFKEQTLVGKDPGHESRQKDLIYMLVLMYEATESTAALQEAIFHALEMFSSTPRRHPDRAAQLSDWVSIMIEKWTVSRSSDEFNEIMLIMREIGVELSIENPVKDGEPVTISLTMPDLLNL